VNSKLYKWILIAILVLIAIPLVYFLVFDEDKQEVNENYTIEVVTVANEAKSAFDDISTVTYKSMDMWTPEDIDLFYTALQTLKGLEQKVNNIQPPEEYKSSHQEFLAACISYGRSAELIEAGLESMDANMLNMALVHMEDGNNHMSRATTMLQMMDQSEY